MFQASVFNARSAAPAFTYLDHILNFKSVQSYKNEMPLAVEIVTEFYIELIVALPVGNCVDHRE